MTGRHYPQSRRSLPLLHKELTLAYCLSLIGGLTTSNQGTQEQWKSAT